MRINKKAYSNTRWYSVIISLLMIGFLLVLTSWVFNLVLKEMYDNRGMWKYIQTYAWAESGQELALLQIKDNGYGYYDFIEHTPNDRSIVLSKTPTELSSFQKSNDIFISYDIGSKVNDYNGSLEPLEYDIIPLFYIDEHGEQKVNMIDFSITFGSGDNLSWNIISRISWISGKNSNLVGYKKTLGTNGTVREFWFTTESINTFLLNNDTNYLVLFNSGDFGRIDYHIDTLDRTEFFSKPETEIISSAQVWNYKQNLRTTLNNTEYLNILRYSIYSN